MSILNHCYECVKLVREVSKSGRCVDCEYRRSKANEELCNSSTIPEGYVQISEAFLRELVGDRLVDSLKEMCCYEDKPFMLG